MKLISISVRGLKGGDGQPIHLGDATLIVGANAAGKTRVLDAALLAVLGRHPDWPKTTDGILASAAGDEIEIVAEFDTDEGPVTVTRTWSRSEITRGKRAGEIEVSTDVVLSHQSARTLSARQRLADQFFGLPEDKVARSDAESALDIRAFLALSDDKKRSALLRLSATAVAVAWTPEAVREALPEHLAKIADGWKRGESVAEFVERIAVEARDAANEVAKSQRNAHAAVEQLDDDSEPVEPADVGELRKKYQSAVDERARIHAATQARIEQARAKLDEGAAAHRRAGNSKTMADAARADLAKLRSVGTDDALVTKLRSEIDALDNGWISIDVLRTDAKDARTVADASVFPTLLSQMAADVDAFRPVVEAAVSEQARAFSEAATSDNEARALQAAISSLTTAGGGACPTCGQVVTEAAVKTLRHRLDEARKRAADARVSEQNAAASKVELRAKLGAAETALNRERQAAQAKRAELDAAARKAADMVTAAERRRERLLLDLRSAESCEPDAQRIAEVEGRIAELDAAARVDLPDLDNLRAGLTEAERQAKIARDEAQGEADKLALFLEDEERKLSRRQHALEARALAAELDEKLATARATQAALGPRGLLGKVMRSVLDPFVADVNAFLDGLDLGVFDVSLLDERGNEVFRPGIQRSDSFSPLTTLSQSERSAVCAGLSLALSRLAGLPWRPVLVDEIQSLDGPGFGRRRQTFMERVLDIVCSGEASQALMVGCPDDVSAPLGVDVVRLETTR